MRSGPDYWGIPAVFEDLMFRQKKDALLTVSGVFAAFLLSYQLLSGL